MSSTTGNNKGWGVTRMVVHGEDSQLREVNVLRKKMRTYEAQKIAFQTKIFDLEGKVDIFVGITSLNGKLMSKVDSLTKEKQVLSLFQEFQMKKSINLSFDLGTKTDDVLALMEVFERLMRSKGEYNNTIDALEEVVLKVGEEYFTMW